MMQPQLNKISIQGFRSFGKARQVIDLAPSISVLWGGNSQGKTTFAEAVEFLLTGQIARRELSASAKDEFAEALRNAHIDPKFPVVVEAHIRCSDGQVRRLTRTLTEDYRRGTAAGAVSRLEIDGERCTEGEIGSRLGLSLSHAPLKAPVLAQHTLGYLFSASPTDRAAYFRAILDTQDLEDFRTAVAELQPLLKAPVLPELDDLEAVEAIPALVSLVSSLRRSQTQAELEKHLLRNTSALLVSAGLTPAVTLAEQSDQIEEELERRRAQTFPLALFGRGTFAPWDGSADTLKKAIDTFLDERGKVDAETRRMVDLFKAALALPNHPTEHDAQDCPLCGAVKTFTAERVSFIRERVKATDAYIGAAQAFQTSLQTMNGQLEALEQSASQARPRFMRETAAARRSAGFQLARIRVLEADELIVGRWLKAVRLWWRAHHNLRVAIANVLTGSQAALSTPDIWSGGQQLADGVAEVQDAQKQFAAMVLAYDSPAKDLGARLKTAVDESTNAKGWEPLIRVSRNPTGLWHGLAAVAAHAGKVAGLEKALKEIDAGNGKVLDEKFDDLSKEVRAWWDRLRPDESAFFDAVQRRSGRARRTIDLKVGLSAKDDHSNPKFRDAVAVFSQSQLHCLGLALFLARAVEERTGFIVLDDPVLTSDDDYRPNFASSVLEGLLGDGMQVIICTQDHKSWKDIGDRWAYRGAVQFQLITNDPVDGTEIRNQNDDLATMIAKAQPFVKSKDPVVRKDGASRVREAIERFAKIMLVKERQSKGETLASITDYDGKNFGTYSQQIMGLLTKDPSHPGKLQAAHRYVTPGPHDDKPPSEGELAGALGELKRLKKDYLD